MFVSPESHDSPTPTVVWVVDPTGPAEIAEHVNGGVSALAADATNFYVVSNSTVIGYTRSTGNQMGQWNLPAINTANTSNADLVSMVAAAGEVLVMIAQGNLEDVYRLHPASAAAPQMIAQGTSAAIGPDGTVYYERSDNHLVALSPTGVTTVGPALANAPNGSGGGIAGIDAVAGGLVWVSDPAGQGLDAQLIPYSATTLQAMGSYSGSVTEQIVDTSAGPLVLSGADGPGGCPQGDSATSTSCVFRISPAAAPQRSDAGGLRRSTGRPLPGRGHRQRHHQRPRGGPALLRRLLPPPQPRRRGGRGSACTMLRCWIGRVMAT